MDRWAIYGWCRLFGHKALTLHVIDAYWVRQEFYADGTDAVEALIKHSLDIVADSKILFRKKEEWCQYSGNFQ